MSQIRKRPQRLDPQSRLIELGLHRKQRSAFHPAVPNSGVFRKAMFVLRRAQKLVGLPQTVPFFFCKRGVATLNDVIIHRDDVESSAVREFEKSPEALSAKEVQNESRPKNHANPGRWLSPEVRYPATSPVPR